MATDAAQTLTISAGERGKIRVLAVNIAPAELTARIEAASKSAVVAELTGQALPDTGFDLVALRDLEGLGLSAYLTQGYALDAAQLEGHAAKLAALEGYVLVLFSSAFGGSTATVTLGADLSPVATFSEEPDDIAAPLPDVESAQPYTGPAAPTARPAKPRGADAALVLTLLALGVIALIFGAFVFLKGG